MKTNTVKRNLINSAHSHLITGHEDTTTEQAAGTTLLSLYIDNHMNWK